MVCTDNKILLKNFKELPAIFCMQRSAEKKIVTEKELILSNKNGFGDEIGTITNRITEMFDILAKFENDSIEYRELMFRIKCGQHYQQAAIDRIKGCAFKPMPKAWYDVEANKIKEEDTEETIAEKKLNMKILANKKPYFFIHIYPKLNRDYKQFIKEINDKCISKFELTFDELLQLENKTEEQDNFIKYSELKNPITDNKCVMNRICHHIEDEFSDIRDKLKVDKFNVSILKTNKEYGKSTYKKINKIYDEYCNEIKQFKIRVKEERMDKNEKNGQLIILKEDFKYKCMAICSEEDLCNILIDICYKTNKSKQFVWDVVGERIFQNLLEKNNYVMEYPVEDKDGDIDFKGYKFSMKRFNLKEEK